MATASADVKTDANGDELAAAVVREALTVGRCSLPSERAAFEDRLTGTVRTM